jgi:hypothetical protein
VAARKRMSRKELKQADPLTESLERLSKQLVEHKTRIVAGVVALVVVLASAGAYGYWRDKKEEEQADLVASAFAALSAPVGTEAVTEAKGEAFIDDESRRKAVAERMKVLEESYGGSALGDAGTWLKATSGAADDGKAPDEAALKALGGLSEKASGLGPWAELARARVAWDSGDKDGARKAFAAAAGAEDGPLAVRAIAKLSLADLDNPQLRSEGGDVAKARGAYREVLAMLDGEPEKETALKAIRNETALRLALLPGGHEEKLSPPEPKAEEAAEGSVEGKEKKAEEGSAKTDEKPEPAKSAGEKAPSEAGAKTGEE